MTTTITKDMQTDPGGVFEGRGTIEFPYDAINKDISANFIRDGVPNYARRSWLAEYGRS